MEKTKTETYKEIDLKTAFGPIIKKLENIENDILDKNPLIKSSITASLIRLENLINDGFNFKNINGLLKSQSVLIDHLSLSTNKEVQLRTYKEVINILELLFYNLFTEIYNDYIFYSIFNCLKLFYFNTSKINEIIITSNVISFTKNIDLVDEITSFLDLKKETVNNIQKLSKVKEVIVTLYNNITNPAKNISDISLAKENLKNILSSYSLTSKDEELILNKFDEVVNYIRDSLQTKNYIIESIEELKLKIPLPNPNNIQKTQQANSIRGIYIPVESIKDQNRQAELLAVIKYQNLVKQKITEIFKLCDDYFIKIDKPLADKKFKYIENILIHLAVIEQLGVFGSHLSINEFLVSLPKTIHEVYTEHGIVGLETVLIQDVFNYILQVNFIYNFSNHDNIQISNNVRNQNLTHKNVDNFVTRYRNSQIGRERIQRILDPNQKVDLLDDDISQFNKEEENNTIIATYEGPEESAPVLLSRLFQISYNGECTPIKLPTTQHQQVTTKETHTKQLEKVTISFTGNQPNLPIPNNLTKIEIYSDNNQEYKISYLHTNNLEIPVEILFESPALNPTITGEINPEIANQRLKISKSILKESGVERLNDQELNDFFEQSGLPDKFISEILKYRNKIKNIINRDTQTIISEIDNIARKYIDTEWGRNGAYVGTSITTAFQEISHRMFHDKQPMLCLEISYFMGYILMQLGCSVGIQNALLPKNNQYKAVGHTYLIVDDLEYDPTLILKGAPEHQNENTEINSRSLTSNNKLSSEIYLSQTKVTQLSPDQIKSIPKEFKINYVEIGNEDRTKSLWIKKDWDDISNFSNQDLKDLLLVLVEIEYGGNLHSDNSPLIKTNTHGHLEYIYQSTDLSRDFMLEKINKIKKDQFSINSYKEDVFYNSHNLQLKDNSSLQIKTGERSVIKERRDKDIKIVKERVDSIIDIQNLLRKNYNSSKHYRISDKSFEYLKTISDILDLLI